MTSQNLKCLCVAEDMLFIGQNDGKILMHNAMTLDKIAEVKTSGKVPP